MTISASERLRRFYDQFSSDDHVLIVIFADPDAIASAMAAKRLLWRKTAAVTLSNINVIKRPDNIAMVRLLSVKLVHFDDIDLNGFNRFILIDSQPDHNEVFSKFVPDVIIDHHPETGEKVGFRDIRPKYGATSSIMTEYLRAAGIKPSVKLATGLFVAIKTDTSNFERPTLIEDMRAFQFLFRHANVHLSRKIEQADLRFDFLKYFKIAISTLRVHRERAFVHLGPIVNPDICVLVADFFMRINPVKWSIVSGLFEQRLIVIIRNDGFRKDAGRMAKQSFGSLGSAGGHKSIARAEIPIENLEDHVDPEDKKKQLDWIIAQITKGDKPGLK